ncbi:hypothetical protein IM725_19860 [Ramlibacter aquaticus]|uniref:Tetratricopeptide repeat protein n=1 Tax=Ramlibacter aquaticus TaxID=2780094 RepID=A0ABR9SKG5_9BURK|nr:hypothetical protein [Ramlibacter aquaticus]MBE7942828.1 hypothetical protein [Ramlibacter aquaticus]
MLDELAIHLAHAASLSRMQAEEVIGGFQRSGTVADESVASLQPQVRSFYRFHLHSHDSGGDFHLNSAGRQLAAQFQRTRHIQEQRDVLKWRPELVSALDRLIRDNPDFPEGQLHLGFQMRQGSLDDGRRSGKIYATAIAAAEDLWPHGFRGRVAWAQEGNRFYHRLLHQHMQWHIVHSSVAQALRLARKQLRLDPQDALSVRLHLPLLLQASGLYDAADHALAAMGDPNEVVEPQAEFVRWFMHMARGRPVQAVRSLLLALFATPPLRSVLAHHEGADALHLEESPDSFIRDEWSTHLSAGLRIAGVGRESSFQDSIRELLNDRGVEAALDELRQGEQTRGHAHLNSYQRDARMIELVDELYPSGHPTLNFDLHPEMLVSTNFAWTHGHFRKNI